MTSTITTITITDRNEAKFLTAVGFSPTPAPRDGLALDFAFKVSSDLWEARQAYSLNRPVPVLSFIAASRWIDRQIHEHRQHFAPAEWVV